MLVEIVNKIFKRAYPQKVFKKFVDKNVMGINVDLTDSNQKRVLIVYLSPLFRSPYESFHANWSHFFQMIHYFVKGNWCIDICECHDGENAELFVGNKYDVIIGFGEPYERIASQNKDAFKILFITENEPKTVKKKYEERLVYFKQRHPGIKKIKDNSRIKYYDEEQVRLSDALIMMNSPYNVNNLKEYGIPYAAIVSNAMSNNNFVFDSKPVNFQERINKFVLFGCNGMIHKGLDILCDVFRQRPEYELDVFGLNKNDKRLFERLRPKNCHDRGSVNIQKDDFISKVINEHTFVVLPSCSEGMNTGVTTCMLHGLIPIVTRETGLFTEGVFEFDGYKEENIISKLDEVTQMSCEELLAKRNIAYQFARNNYTLDSFNRTFTEAMEKLTDNIR